MGDELQPGEAIPLAREMARAYAAMVRYYQKQYGVTATEADQKTQELMAAPPHDLALTMGIEQLGWWQLNELAARDPDQAIQAWARVKAEARAELASGQTVAKAAEGFGAGPLARARVIAIRQSLIEGWQPGPGIETMLVDTLATAHHGYLFWLERLMARVSTDAQMEEADLNREGKWRPSRIDQAAATQEAAEMVDRFNRIFLRTLRALRDLRRYSSPVHIENAAQVNIGEQQVNVAGSPSSPRLADSQNK